MGYFPNRKLILESSENYTKALCDLCEKARSSSSGCPETCLSDYPSPPDTSTTGNSHSHKASTFLTVTIVLLAASFLIVSGYLLYAKYYSATRRRNNSNNNNDSNNNRDDPLSPSDQITREFLDEEHGATVDHHVWYIRTVGLEPSIIAAITAVKYKKDEGLIDGTDCSVCLSEFQEDETLRLLPKCSHAFHVACIDTWLRSHTNCPMCRAPVLIAAVKASPSPPLEAASSGEEEAESRVAVSERVGDVEGYLEGRDLVESSEHQSAEFEPSRRSVSLDRLDDKVILQVVDKVRGNGEKRSVCDAKKLQRLRSGSSSRSNGRSNGQHSGHGSSMKRSHSCNGKFVLCRPIRLTDSILPLRSI